MGSGDDERLGQLLKAIRRREGLRQTDLERLTGVSRRTQARIEHAESAEVTLKSIRKVFEPLGARVRLTVWWHGAAADRLLDERHAALVERAIAVLRARGWVTEVEVTFSQYGERGSIDILASHSPTRAVLVIEVKATLGSLEETNRMLDIKERLAGRIARERFGWAPASVSRLLILPDESTMRRIVDNHAWTLGSVYPARGRTIRAWLRAPRGPLRGIWFLSEGRQKAMV